MAIDNMSADPKPDSDTDNGGRDGLPIYRPDGRSLGVSFSNVTAVGASGSSQTVTDLLKIFSDILTWPINTGRKLIKDYPQESSPIVQDVTGVLFPGETMLVLGRPGAGCSTVLRVLGNQHQSFQEVHGSIQYAGLSSVEMGKKYRSETVYCAEDDIHLPTLPVKDTLDFALRLRKPQAQPESPSQFSGRMSDRILESLGLSHTKDTRVGDAFVRGVSGGERKRISLAEVLAVNPAIACWDNPLRGLDSSCALSFLKLLRDMSRYTGMSNVATIYQGSEAMYQYFDRVLVMYEGRMIFHGPAGRAKDYFLQLGFHCPERQTTADFLTAITSPAERTYQKTFTGPRYDTAESLAQAFCNSNDYRLLQQDLVRYQEQVASDSSVTSTFQSEVEGMRSKLSPKPIIEPSSLATQTLTALHRQYRLMWRNRTTFITVFILTAVNAAVTASGYYMAPKTTTGSFERSGALWFALVYFNLNALTEVPKTIKSRAVLLKQHRMGYAHPVALVIAEAIAEIPIAFLQALVFACCYYFTIGLDKAASSFWVFVLITFTNLTSISCLFRLLGAWAPNINTGFLMGGCALPIVCLYSGYAPPVPKMHRWGSWIRRISPTPFGVESLMGNEFSGIMLQCTADQLIPHGSGYNDIQYQGCPMVGAVKGSADVSGEIYLAAQYGFNVQFLWRDFGIMLGMWFLYVVLTALGLTIMTRETSTSNARAYRRGANSSGCSVDKTDLEGRYQQPAISSSSSASQSSIRTTVEKTPTRYSVSHSNQRAFSFHNVNYFVYSAGKELHLLNNVTGYAKPGQLTALMGGSGAGKTTLLETISGRKTEGRMEGTLLFDGKYLNPSFSRACGFCMQQDVHEPFATVREALQFSAFLRQPAETSHDQKVQEVEKIMELLELDQIADVIVGSLGVEERKRVTIGVELCARPSALLFLDEPTSGLDSQAAFSIVTFLRKVAAQGIPIVCTIHQPSSVIFEMFDHALILAPGGRTVYFGETREPLNDYFAQRGAIMGQQDNPAEFIITTVAASRNGGAGADWPRLWQESEQCREVNDRVLAMAEKASPDFESDTVPAKQYALPLTAQISHLTKRQWKSVWRNGPYNFSKLFKSVFFELLVAFTFFEAGSDTNGLQNHALALLIATWVVPAIANDIQELWFEKWSVFEARERNGIYDYKALLVAMIAVETPWQAFNFSLIFLCSYWTVGFPGSSAAAGMIYFMYLLFSFFATGFCYLMASMFPNSTMAGNANSLFWVIFMMFGGVVVPRNALNDFYRPWITWADPMRYYFSATVSSSLHGVRAACSDSDLAIFDPPAGQSCGDYVEPYRRSNVGYLQNPDATASCEYCPYSVGDDYAATMEFFYNERWRDWAVFLCFCLTNVALVFCISWLTRVQIRRWRQ